MGVKMTLEFSEESVREIVKAHLEAQGYEVIGAVEIKVGQKLVGFGCAERFEPSFEGVEAVVRRQEDK